MCGGPTNSQLVSRLLFGADVLTADEEILAPCLRLGRDVRFCCNCRLGQRHEGRFARGSLKCV